MTAYENEVNNYIESAKKSDEYEYLKMCAKAAVELMNVFTKQGHSGMSAGLTINMFKTLANGGVLSPITEQDSFSEPRILGSNPKRSSEQCTRYSSLFKDTYEDGHTEYHDINRFTLYNIGKDIPFYNGLVSRELHKQFPITVPLNYYPEKYKAYINEELLDKRNGDYDTIRIVYVDTPNNERIHINKYYTDRDNLSGTGIVGTEIGDMDFVEITEGQYIAIKCKTKGSQHE